MNKYRLGYIDHSYHQKTKSTNFLRNILSEHFEVVDIWDESWNGKTSLTAEYINSFDFGYVMFFQSLLPISELKKIKAKIIWVPMYDSVVSCTDDFWYELSSLQIKVISFSDNLLVKIKKAGIDALSVKYFINSSLILPVTNYTSKRIFFWQRTNITLEDVKKIIGNQKIDKIILKVDSDPGFKVQMPSADDIKKYNIEIINWSTSREEYLNKMLECNIYISPRKYEGIGMSFIEAMTAGMTVIAYNNPTMNEYITHEENGFLFSDSCKEIDLNDHARTGLAALRYCENGFIKWQKDAKKILEYVESKYEIPKKINGFYLICLRMLSLFTKVARRIGLLSV